LQIPFSPAIFQRPEQCRHATPDLNFFVDGKNENTKIFPWLLQHSAANG